MNWIRISLVVVVLGIIFLSLKTPTEGMEIKVNDKVGHILAYSVLAVNAGLLFTKNKWWLVALAAFSFSALLEYLQGFVPGRTVDWKDLVANASGILIGLLVLLLLKESILKLLRKLNLI